MSLTSPLLRTTTLLGATITMGLVAGVFALYAHTIMPGLHKTDDRTFVAAFQQVDRVIIDVARVRAQFRETRWAAANLVRVATTTPAFGLLAWALVLCGRVGG
jgi:uncharacterized membrane protein